MATVLAVQGVEINRKQSIDDDNEGGHVATSGSSFTKKLFEILDSSESSDIVSWTQGM
jgi:hypothetical protein